MYAFQDPMPEPCAVRVAAKRISSDNIYFFMSSRVHKFAKYTYLIYIKQRDMGFIACKIVFNDMLYLVENYGNNFVKIISFK